MMRALTAALLLTVTLAVADETNAPDPNFAWLVDFLTTNSSVTIAATDDQPREDINTRTNGKVFQDALIVEYERFTYQLDTPDDLDRHQRILYTVNLTTIDPETITVQRAGESAPGVPFWMVSFDVRTDPGYFPYMNIIEHHGETKTPQVFTSKGKIRQVILGYVANEELAKELAEKFSASLKAALADLKRPTQSAA